MGMTIDQQARAAEQLEWLRRKAEPPNAGRRLALAAEHEAAHAVVARALGVPVHQIWVDEHGNGEMLFDSVEAFDRRVRAAFTIAPQVWIPRRFMQFPEGDRGCRLDNRALVLDAGDAFSRAEAHRLAAGILHKHQNEVLRVARRVLEAPRHTLDFHPRPGEVPAQLARLSRRTEPCRLTLPEVGQIMVDVGLVAAGSLASARAARVEGLAAALRIRPRADEFGRASLSRAEAVRVVAAERQRRQDARVEAAESEEARRQAFQEVVRSRNAKAQAESAARLDAAKAATERRIPAGVMPTRYGASLLGLDPSTGEGAA